MLKQINVETTTVVLKNCYRCGGEFSLGANERLCASCRKPRQYRARLLGPHLTFREKQIVDLVCQAKLNKEIAFHLHLTEGTIKEYLNRIFRKLAVRSRTELAVWALNHRADWHPAFTKNEARPRQIA